MIHDFMTMKAQGEKITFLTAYDFPTAQFAEAAGLDMLLVGDSLGMCVCRGIREGLFALIEWAFTDKGRRHPACTGGA
jgi:ketopantoate hydroxymethyltransferase